MGDALILRPFTISRLFIWLSSFCIGVLASVPKLLRLGLSAHELGVDISIASLFSVFVWYFNIYQLNRRPPQKASAGFFSLELLRTLILGLVVMFVLGSIHQVFFPHYDFGSMVGMFEFRGGVINLTINLFLYLSYQEYLNRQVGLELEKSRADQLSAQLESLKQQVNPHFLFNSLNTLKSMVEGGDKHAPEFIVRLSEFYRSTLENRRRNLIALGEELEIVGSYMFLLKARFEEGFDLKVEIAEKHRNTVMPAFTLKLLLENCIKHNVILPDQVLYIRIYSEKDRICVANNRQPKRSVGLSTGVGLQNIKDRYRQLGYGEVVVEEEREHFIVKLPVIHENSHY
ncbi:MAG: histidine kinase [Bacteroidetes bacterium]|nr:histidine kinase [Bacteroidota bacterium]